jgi:hypothetical protein
MTAWSAGTGPWSPAWSIDRDLSVDGARQFWADLCAQGWRRVTEQELSASRMSHRRLREMAYAR